MWESPHLLGGNSLELVFTVKGLSQMDGCTLLSDITQYLDAGLGWPRWLRIRIGTQGTQATAYTV